MKKGYLAAFLAAALVAAIGFTACSGGGSASSGSASAASASSSAASAEASSASAAASEEASAASDAVSSEVASSAAAEASAEPSASSASAASPKTDGSAYGYAGDDPVEVAVYKYMAEEVSKNFEKADASIPTVSIVHVDNASPDEVLVYGDFWIDNYNISGNTLECVSGGNFPGVMHLGKDGDVYVVSSFDRTADGAGFESSAKELFGEYYDEFMKVYSDSDSRDELRKATVAEYVKLNGLDVTQYQDYGWDPVKL